MTHQLVKSLRSQTLAAIRKGEGQGIRSLIGHVGGLLNQADTLGHDQKQSLRGFRRSLRGALVSRKKEKNRKTARR